MCGAVCHIQFPFCYVENVSKIDPGVLECRFFCLQCQCTANVSLIRSRVACMPWHLYACNLRLHQMQDHYWCHHDGTSPSHGTERKEIHGWLESNKSLLKQCNHTMPCQLKGRISTVTLRHRLRIDLQSTSWQLTCLSLAPTPRTRVRAIDQPRIEIWGRTT